MTEVREEMMDEQTLQLQRETRSSIELTRNARGEYHWVIKIYFDGSADEADDTLMRLRQIDLDLRTGYVR